VAKQTGIGGRLWVGSSDISGDVGAITGLNQSRAQIDVTGIDKEFMERLPGLGDGSIEWSGFYNNTGANAVLSGMGTANQTVTAAFGTAAGATAFSLSGAQATYNVSRSADGALAHTSNFNSRSGFGLEHGVIHIGGASASGTGVAVDWGAASANGASAYLHVLSVAAGTVTVIVEHSTSGTASWSTVTGLSFTAASAGTSERVATAAGVTVNRYTRYSVSGGTATIAVNVHRNPV
jgi:hypothetical protein